jgi:hypothetical protein
MTADLKFMAIDAYHYMFQLMPSTVIRQPRILLMEKEYVWPPPDQLWQYLSYRPLLNVLFFYLDYSYSIS